MTLPPAQQLQTCCTVVSSLWSSRAPVAPGMKYLFISRTVTTAPHWIPLWLLGYSLLDVDVIRVMSCVLCCRAECGHTQESCSHHDFVMTSSTFRNGKTIWRVVKQDATSLYSCWCRCSVVFLTSQHHQPPRHVQEEYYLHSDSFVIYNFSILFWCCLVAYAVLLCSCDWDALCVMRRSDAAHVATHTRQLFATSCSMVLQDAVTASLPGFSVQGTNGFRATNLQLPLVATQVVFAFM